MSQDYMHTSKYKKKSLTVTELGVFVEGTFTQGIFAGEIFAKRILRLTDFFDEWKFRRTKVSPKRSSKLSLQAAGEVDDNQISVNIGL